MRIEGGILAFMISILRAVIEMIGLCMLGQAVLFVLAGRRRAGNHIYRLFVLVTSPPRRLVATLTGHREDTVFVGMATFAIMLILWIGLAVLRKFV